ncbi:MAG: DMT family transporter [Eubacteriales bacterium]|nr:DMT family transporter [Eubacteriales bacterium]MDY2934438.1 DMT family transporter [Anaerovoracaceae bacterium]
MKTQGNGKTYFLMVIAALVWSGAFIAGKFAVPYVPAFTLTFLRFLISSAVLYPVMKLYNRAHPKDNFKLTKKYIPLFLFNGIVGMLGYHALFFTALKYTSAINSSIIGAMNPIVTTVIASITMKQKTPPVQTAGIALSFTGVVLTITGDNLSMLTSFDFNRGDIFMAAAVICWASYAVMSKAKGAEVPPLALTFYSFVFCTITLIPFVIWEHPWTLEKIPVSAILAIIFMAVFSSVIGYMLQQIAIKKIGASKSSIFVNLVPVFSIILSVIILGEELIPVKIFTSLLIIAGVCICQMSGKRKHQTEALKNKFS